MLIKPATFEFYTLSLNKISGTENRQHIIIFSVDHTYNMSRPVLTTVHDGYNQYVQYMNQISSSQVKNSAKLANTAIYGARDYINFGLASLMARDDVKYAKSISDRVYQQVFQCILILCFQFLRLFTGIILHIEFNYQIITTLYHTTKHFFINDVCLMKFVFMNVDSIVVFI